MPKSNTRAQVAIAAGFTQVAIVKSVSPPAMPVGRATYWAGLPPPNCSALPNLPGTRGMSAGATHWTGVAGSMNARLRISSAYSPPTPA